MVSEELKVLIKAEVADAVKNLSQFQKAAKETQSTVDRMGKELLKAAGSIVGAYASFRGLVSIVESSIAAFKEQERAERELAAALNSIVEGADVLTSRYKEFASEIQRVTIYGDEQVLKLMRLGLQYGITTDKIEDATKGAIGLASAFGVDLETSMRLVTLANQGNYDALQRYIPSLRAARTEGEKAAIVNKAMADGFKLAQETAGTTFGALAQLKNAVGDLGESIGKILAPALAEGAKALTGFFVVLGGAISETQKLAEINKKLSMKETLTAQEQLVLLRSRLSKIEDEIRTKGDYYTEKQLNALYQERDIIKEQIRAAEKLAVTEKEKKNAVIATVQAKEQEIKLTAQALADQEAKRKADIELVKKHAQAEIEANEEAMRQWVENYEKYREERNKALEKAAKVEKDQLMKIAEAEIEDRELAIKSMIENYERLNEERRRADEKAAREAAESARRWAESWESAIKTVESGLLDLWSMALALDRERMGREVANIRKQTEAAKKEFEKQKKLKEQFGIDTAEFEEEWQKKKELLEAEAQKKENELRRRQFEKEKQLRIASTLAAGAEAVIATFAKLGWPWGIPAAAAMAAITAAKVSMIQSQKFPAMAEGGIVKPKPGGTIVQVAEAGKPEAIVPLEEGMKTIGGETNIIINIEGVVGDRDAVIRWVAEGIERAKKVRRL